MKWQLKKGHISYSNSFGVSIKNKWSPAPRYILRRNIFLDMLKKINPGKVIEIGCGSGTILYDLAKRQYFGYGIDKSNEAINLAKKVLHGIKEFKIVSKSPEKEKASFDLLIAFEVLEHIDDDIYTLKKWKQFLNPSGQLIISVPAHRKKWGEKDIWAGHFRRYERKELLSKLNEVGFENIQIKNYGWPFFVFLRPIHEKIYKKKNEENNKYTMKQRTYRSGIDRSTAIKTFPFINNPFGKFFFIILSWFQNFLFSLELGDGYIVQVNKSDKEISLS